MRRTISCILALCLLASVLPLPARGAQGYTVGLSEDVSISAGETATVCVEVGSDTHTFFNAYDLELHYDPELTLLDITSTNPYEYIQKTDTSVQVRGYGERRSLSKTAFTLHFTAKKMGEYRVWMQRAAIDESDQAPGRNAPLAALVGAETTITVTGGRFLVTKIGEGILGEDYAFQGKDYTFSLEKSQYYASSVTVTVDGEPVEPTYDSATGLYTIPGEAVTGPITLTRPGKTFSVTLTGKDLTGEKQATFGQDYSFKLDRKEGFLYEIEVTINGKSYTAYTVDSDVYTIPGADIKGNIKIKSTRTEDDTGKVNVKFIGSGSKDGKGQKKTPEGVEYPFQIRQRKGYTYSISIWINGKRVGYDYDSNLDMYYIPSESVTGDITIVVSRVATVEVSEYLTLDESSMFLVVFNGKVKKDETAYYDGQRMYWSDRYGGYCWLVVSEDSEKKVKQAAESVIRVASGSRIGTVDYSGDVDGNGEIQVKDAQEIWKMYNVATTLEARGILPFLRADVATDRKLDVRDAAAVVNILLGH